MLATRYTCVVKDDIDNDDVSMYVGSNNEDIISLILMTS